MREVLKFDADELQDLHGKIVHQEELELLRDMDETYDYDEVGRSVVHPNCTWHHLKIRKSERDGIKNLHIDVYVEKQRRINYE